MPLAVLPVQRTLRWTKDKYGLSWQVSLAAGEAKDNASPQP